MSVRRTMSKAYHLERPYDPGGVAAMPCNHTICSILPASVLQAAPGIPVVRHRTRRRKYVDVCSGQQSLVKYLLLVDPSAEVLSIDIVSKEEALSEVPQHLWHRIHYVCLDLEKQPLTLDRLQRLVRQHLHCDMLGLYGIHFSPCCKSYSTADAGRSGFRLTCGAPNPNVCYSDGTPNPGRYRYAVIWDHIVAIMLHTLDQVSQQNTSILISVENPYGAFRLHPSVVELASRPDWRILEVDYCKAADPEYDGDRIFTQKRSDILTHGVRSVDHALRHTKVPSRLSFQVPR